jgi:hypothetical protein
MNETLSVKELEKRYKEVLVATDKAVAKHPDVYHEIKSLACDVVTKPLDIKDYPITAEKLVKLFKTLDYNTQGSIFHFYYDRVWPLSICNLKFFRVECQDLLEHLKAFDEWRKEKRRLRVLK